MYVCNCSVYIQKKKKKKTTTAPKLGGSEDGIDGRCTVRSVFGVARGRHTTTGAGTHTHKTDVYTL